MKKLILIWMTSFVALIYYHPIKFIYYFQKYLKSYFSYRKISQFERVSFIDTHPCLLDQTRSTPFDAHYFYQGAWLAREISKNNPSLHVDIGSSVMMISMLSAMVKTLFIDYRPLHVDLPDIQSIGASILQIPLADESVDSLSCQHVIEHIGLGRYGDSVDSLGTLKSAKELERILKVGGLLYLSLPVGRERVCFNAHRVLHPESVPKLFANMKLTKFSCVTDSGEFVKDGDMKSVRNDDYACGMYILEKLFVT